MEQLDALLRLMVSLCVNALKTSEIILIRLIKDNSHHVRCNENMAKAGFNAAAASASGGLTNLFNNNEATSLRSETSLCLVVMIILSVIIGLQE